MKKILLIAINLLAIIFSAVIFSGAVFAEEESDYGKEIVESALPDEVSEDLAEIGVEYDNNGVLSLTPTQVIQQIIDIFLEQINKPLKLLGMLMGVIILASAVEALRDSTGSSSAVSTFQIVAVLAGAGMLCGYIADCISEAGTALTALSTFLMTFTPAFAGIVAVNGQTTTAVAFNATIIVAVQIFTQLATSVIMPLCGSMLGLSIAGAINPDLKINRIAEMIKKVVTWTLGILTTIFTGLLSVQSFITSSADSVTMKMAKFTVSGTVPIIGGAVSDALSTVKGSLGLIKSSVGTFGIIAGCSIMLPVLISVVSFKLVLSIAAAVGELFGATQLSALLKSAESVLSIIVALIVCLMLIAIISTGLILAIGTGA